MVGRIYPERGHVSLCWKPVVSCWSQYCFSFPNNTK